MEKENINYLNEYENEIDIDNEINLLKRKINLVINERKKIEKETFIINNRINLMNKQEKDLQKSCNLKKELKENKENLKQKILELLAKQNNKNINNNII